MHRPRTGAPQILGHESTGVVIAKGREVNHVKEGDTVMVTWVPRDGERATRRAEMTTLELPGGQSATTNCFTWADNTIADEQFVVKVPSDIKKDVTAIIGCAVMTGSGAVYHTAGVRKGQSVAVFGVGGVGLSAIAAAKVVEADPIIAVDLDDSKLEFAKKFGATHGVNASQGDPIAAIRELTTRSGDLDMRGGPVAGVDFAFDCIGVRKTMEQILPAARPGVLGKSTGGTAVLVGVPQTPVELDPLDLLINEKKYIGSIGGSCRPDRDFPMFLRWYHEGDLDLDALVTERFAIDQINEATKALEQGKIAGRSIMEF
jgi:Zn-dependent alcohol dehydrogenase